MGDYQTALKSPGSLGHYDLNPALPIQGALYVRVPSRKPPRWLEFVRSGLAGTLETLENVSTAAVLFIVAGSHTFALTFGHGRNLLKPDSYEMDFGLKVALNIVDPDRLRSVDVRTFEELTLHTRRQTSRGATLDAFGLDVSQDLLRGVTGEPRDISLAKRVTGSDALTLNVQVDLSGLGKKCEEVFAAYKSENYKERFGWIDQMKAVRDPQLIDELNEQLLGALHRQQMERLHLAPPEPLDWDRVESFRYSTEPEGDSHHPDLEIEEYIATLEDLSSLSVTDLKKDRIEVLYAEEEEPFDRWSIYQCIVFETERDGRLYVLTGGRWFEVAGSFAESVKGYITALPASTLALPRARVGEKESDYNQRAANADQQLVLMDRRLARCAGGRGPIEVCDLFSSNKEFVHVKRKARSATLSHLFAQGTVSGEAFLGDSEFRKDARDIVNSLRPSLSSLITLTKPVAADYEVVYAIIAKPGTNSPLSLPFFSQLHFMQAAQRLQLLGFRISTLFVAEV